MTKTTLFLIYEVEDASVEFEKQEIRGWPLDVVEVAVAPEHAGRIARSKAIKQYCNRHPDQAGNWKYRIAIPMSKEGIEIRARAAQQEADHWKFLLNKVS